MDYPPWAMDFLTMDHGLKTIDFERSTKKTHRSFYGLWTMDYGLKEFHEQIRRNTTGSLRGQYAVA